MITLTDLQPFCSEDLTRLSLLHPFKDGVHIYATDGRLIVRTMTTPALLSALPEPAGRLIDAANLPYWHHFDDISLRWHPASTLPSLPAPSWERCTMCHGEGTWTCDCPDCSAEHSCPGCDGFGKYHPPQSVAVGALFVDAAYLRKLLPIITSYTTHITEDWRVLMATGPGIQAILMALKTPTEK